MTDQPSSSSDQAPPSPDATPDAAPGAAQSEPASGVPAVELHGSTDPETSGNVWAGHALSEQPGDHQPAPEGWENPPAREAHGSTTPADQAIWVPQDGGGDGPYALGKTTRTPPDGWVNPPALELHGPTMPRQ